MYTGKNNGAITNKTITDIYRTETYKNSKVENEETKKQLKESSASMYSILSISFSNVLQFTISVALFRHIFSNKIIFLLLPNLHHLSFIP